MTEPSMSFKEALAGLRTAIETEIRGLEFFRAAAERCEDPDGREMFLAMAREEVEHKKLLERQFAHLLEQKRYLPHEELTKDIPIEETAIPVEAFREGLKRSNFEMSAVGIGIISIAGDLPAPLLSAIALSDLHRPWPCHAMSACSPAPSPMRIVPVVAPKLYTAVTPSWHDRHSFESPSGSPTMASSVALAKGVKASRVSAAVRAITPILRKKFELGGVGTGSAKMD